MLALLVILACAGLNRARGDDRWMPSWLPGRALWYVAPAVGAVAMLVQPWPAAICWGIAYVIWGVWPWGRWYGLERMAHGDDEPSTYEAIVEMISLGSDHISMLWRMLAVLPGLVLVMALPQALVASVVFALAAVAAYEAAWRLWPDNPIWRAELGVGALWGGLIVLA